MGSTFKEDVTERLSRLKGRPSTIEEVCRAAGRPHVYERIQQAVYRWERGEGSGVSEEDARWIADVLEE